MEDYRLTQTGAEVQAILDGAAMQVDLTAENERAELAEQTLQGHIDDEEIRAKAAEKQNADDIDAIEEKIPSGATSSNKMATASDISTLQDNIDAEETRAKAAEKQNADDIDAIEAVLPSGATSENKLATEEYVNDSVATNTATFRGTFNLVSDLHLAVDATHAQIAYQLPTLIAVADNNDYCFVLIPTSSETPTQIQAIERYKYNGSAWAFEYELNNSGFTATQWAAINSGITSGDVSKLAALPTNAELTTLMNGKQNVLTFDSVPTQGSNNPVKSGGVYSAIDDEKGARLNSDAALQLSIDGINAKIPSGASSDNKMATESEITTLSQAIEAILLLIPSAATAMNQLADKAFVNSSISTATATFRGTYNLVSDLSLAVNATHAQIAAALSGAVSNADSNDYAFVQIPTSVATPTEIAQTDRYKFNGTEWAYEYTLNTSGFTAAQWGAINSAITSALVEKLIALPNAAELATALLGKQDVLTFDNVPTTGSSNPVKSGGVKSAIDDEKTARENADGLLSNAIGDINGVIPSAATSSNKLVDNAAMTSAIGAVIGQLDATFNITSTDGHVTLQVTQVDGVITSVQLTTSDIASAAALNLKASQADLTALTGRVATAEGDIETLTALYNALQQSAPQVIEPTDTWPVANPSSTVIYRVIDRVNTPPEYYSDYMWNGASMVLMATYNNAIDTTPKKGSVNLITSGGVFNNIGAFDVSEYHKSGGTLATYVDLSAALASIPSDYQKGGMSIKFVQSSDNMYVQYRLMSDSFNTTVDNWQGVDNEPTAGSNNLVKSGGVYNEFNDTQKTTLIPFTLNPALPFYLVSDNTPIYSENRNKSVAIKVNTGDAFYYNVSNYSSTYSIVALDSSKTIIPEKCIAFDGRRNGIYIVQQGTEYLIFVAEPDDSYKEVYKLDSLIGLEKENVINGISNTGLYPFSNDRYKVPFYVVGNTTPNFTVDRYKTDIIPVKAGDKFYLKVYCPSNTYAIVALDSELNIIQSLSKAGTDVGYFEYEYEVPVGVGYIIFVGYIYNDYPDSIAYKIDSMRNSIESLNNGMAGERMKIFRYNINSQIYINDSGVLAATGAENGYKTLKFYVKKASNVLLKTSHGNPYHPTLCRYTDGAYSTLDKIILETTDALDSIIYLEEGYYAICINNEQMYVLGNEFAITFISDYIVDSIEDMSPKQEALASLDNKDLILINNATISNDIITFDGNAMAEVHFGRFNIDKYSVSAKFKCIGEPYFKLGRKDDVGFDIELYNENNKGHIKITCLPGHPNPTIREYELPFIFNQNEIYTITYNMYVGTDYSLDIFIYGQYNEYYEITDFHNINTLYNVGWIYFSSNVETLLLSTSLSINSYVNVATPKIGIWGHSFIGADSISERDKSFSNLLRNKIGERDVIISGLGGDALYGNTFFERVKNEITLCKNVKYALICMGANDIAYGVDQFKINISKVIEYISRFDITPVIFTVGPMWETKPTTLSSPTNVQQINAWIRSSGYLYVDMEQVFVTVDCSSNPLITPQDVRVDLYFDDVHPTIEGHELIYKRILMDCPYLL